MKLYNKTLKKTVDVVYINEPFFEGKDNDQLQAEVFFWNPRKGSWDIEWLSKFTPPKTVSKTARKQ